MCNVHLNQKKKKKEEGKNRQRGKEKKKKKEVKKSKVQTKPMCKYTRTFLFIKQPHFLPSVSLHFGKKTFQWVQRENNQAPPFIFLPPHPAKHTPKKFSFPFSLQSFLSILFHLQTNTPLMSYTRCNLNIYIYIYIIEI